MWAKKGYRPTAHHTRKYEWLYLYGFVRPKTGETHWLILPTVNLEYMKEALKDFKVTIDPENKKIIILLIDGAGFHQLSKADIPEGIILYPLPAYTPQLQPAEPLWKLVKEAVANECISTIQQLDGIVAKRCNWLYDNPDIVKGVSGFQWIIDAS